MPNFHDWHIWAFLAVVAAYIALNYGPKIVGLLGGIRLPSLTGATTAPTRATAAQAFAAVELLAGYKRDAKDDAAYNAVLAAWKSEAPA